LAVAALGQQADFHPACAGTRGTWAEKDAWLQRLNAILAAVPM
jgi:hypothetical protein